MCDMHTHTHTSFSSPPRPWFALPPKTGRDKQFTSFHFFGCRKSCWIIEMPGLGTSPWPSLMFQIRYDTRLLYSGSLGENICTYRWSGDGFWSLVPPFEIKNITLFALQSHNHFNSPFEVRLKALLSTGPGPNCAAIQQCFFSFK